MTRFFAQMKTYMILHPLGLPVPPDMPRLPRIVGWLVLTSNAFFGGVS